jgi:hypothetical protein
VPRQLGSEDVDEKIQFSEASIDRSKERDGSQLPTDEQQLRLLLFVRAFESS